MLACQVDILVAFKDQSAIDKLIKENHPEPYAERYKTCSGLLAPVNAWLKDQQKNKEYLWVEVRYVHIDEVKSDKSILIKTTELP